MKNMILVLSILTALPAYARPVTCEVKCQVYSAKVLAMSDDRVSFGEAALEFEQACHAKGGHIAEPGPFDSSRKHACIQDVEEQMVIKQTWDVWKEEVDVLNNRREALSQARGGCTGILCGPGTHKLCWAANLYQQFPRIVHETCY